RMLTGCHDNRRGFGCPFASPLTSLLPRRVSKVRGAKESPAETRLLALELERANQAPVSGSRSAVRAAICSSAAVRLPPLLCATTSRAPEQCPPLPGLNLFAPIEFLGFLRK